MFFFQLLQAGAWAGDRPVPAKPPAPGDPASGATDHRADAGGANADGAGEPQYGDRPRHASGTGKAEQEEIRWWSVIAFFTATFPNPRTQFQPMLLCQMARIELIFSNHLMPRPGFKPTSVMFLRTSETFWRMLYQLSHSMIRFSYDSIQFRKRCINVFFQNFSFLFCLP